MRDLVYYVASTLDGFIAHADGSFDGFPWDDEYGADLLASFPETFPIHLKDAKNSSNDNKWFDTVLMGRKTYEVGLKEGVTNPYPTLDQYVFSRTLSKSPDRGIKLITDNAVETVRALKQESGKAIWLCGGADIATTLLEANLIDKIIVKLNPVTFGSGIGLFSKTIAPTALKLTGHKIYNSGHIVLHYQVQRNAD
jgi:dihydrofolate reductase